MANLGDFALETTIHTKFTTRSFSTGAPTQLAGTPAVEIYEDNSTTQITAAETLTVDFDSVTGLNHLAIAATAANGFEAGKFYAAVISAGTVGGVSVVGEVICTFSIEATAALRPATNGREIVLDANGGVDLRTVAGSAVNALVSGRMDSSTGAMAANVLTAAATAADFGTEIGTAVWATTTRILTALDEDNTTIDINAAILAAVGLATGNLDTQLADIEGKVDDLESRLGTPSDLGSGATVAANLVDIEGQTDNIPADPADASDIAALFDALPTAAEIRTEIDSNSTQLAAIVADTNELQTDWVNGGRLDLLIDGIKAKTDSLNFGVTGKVDANVTHVNEIEVTGDGQTGTEWGPA